MTQSSNAFMGCERKGMGESMGGGRAKKAKCELRWAGGLLRESRVGVVLVQSVRLDKLGYLKY